MITQVGRLEPVAAPKSYIRGEKLLGTGHKVTHQLNLTHSHVLLAHISFKNISDQLPSFKLKLSFQAMVPQAYTEYSHMA